MKKIISTLLFFLCVTLVANAQEKKAPNNNELGKKDAVELSQYIGGMSETMIADFARLFEHKYRTLEEIKGSEERKKELSKSIEAKIRATLDGNQMDKLDKNPALLKKLIN